MLPFFSKTLKFITLNFFITAILFLHYQHYCFTPVSIDNKSVKFLKFWNLKFKSEQDIFKISYVNDRIFGSSQSVPWK